MLRYTNLLPFQTARRKLRVSFVSSLTAKTNASHNASSPNTDTQINNKQINRQQFMTIRQRFQYFPTAFRSIVRDVRIYFLMQDALTTRRNQWSTATPVWVHWKQQHLRKELAWVVPLAGACMLPVVGYIPSLLAFAFPRQMLTRHFWNDYELEYFESSALKTRHYFTALVCDYWWKHYRKDMVLLFQQINNNGNSHDVKSSSVVNLSHDDDQYPPEYWKQVALAAGCFSFTSNNDHSTTHSIFVLYWKWQARINLKQLAADDTLLLNAVALQDSEVQQACRERALVDEDRQALELYLDRVNNLRWRTRESDWGLVSLLISGYSGQNNM